MHIAFDLILRDTVSLWLVSLWLVSLWLRSHQRAKVSCRSVPAQALMARERPLSANLPE